MENGSRIFRGEAMFLEWWSPTIGCEGRKEQESEVWIRVIGLPLHLWSENILKELGDRCGGFVGMDKATTHRKDLRWARILVKNSCYRKPSSVNMLAGARSYELQIWWEIQPKVVGVYPKVYRSKGSWTKPSEEDEGDSRANVRVREAFGKRLHTNQEWQWAESQKMGQELSVLAGGMVQPLKCFGTLKVGPKTCCVSLNNLGTKEIEAGDMCGRERDSKSNHFGLQSGIDEAHKFSPRQEFCMGKSPKINRKQTGCPIEKKDVDYQMINCKKRHNYRDGQSKEGIRTTLEGGAAESSLTISQPRGLFSKVGINKCVEIQNVVGISGRNGKPKNSFLMDSAKEIYGPLTKDKHGLLGERDVAHVSNKIQGSTEGPSNRNNGERCASPTKRHHPHNLRADCKGIGVKIGLTTTSCSGTKAREVSAVEEKGSPETTSKQGQGRKDVGGEGKISDAQDKDSPSGKFLEIISKAAELEHNGEKDDSHPVAADALRNIPRDYIQADEMSKCSHRDSRLKIACLRVEEEGEDDSGVERSVFSVGKGLGKIDGTRPASSGREHCHRLDSQAGKLSEQGQIFREGQGSGHVLDQGLGHVMDLSPDSCRVLGPSPGMGQISRATLRSEYINQVRFNESILPEPTGFKAQVELLETGPSQVLFSKPVETSERLEPIPRSSEAGQEGIVSSHEEEDEHIEDVARAKGHKLKKRYAENFFDQSISTPFSVFGRPLLLGDSSGLGDPLLEKALPLRIVGADGKEWSSESTGGISDEGEETDVVGQRKEVQSESFENWNNGS